MRRVFDPWPFGETQRHFPPTTHEDWSDEVRRAVAWLVCESNTGVERGKAAEMLEHELAKELGRILERLGVADDLELAGEGATLKSVNDAIRRRDLAMWRPGPDGLAPMDAAWLEVLETLATPDDADKGRGHATKLAGKGGHGAEAGWRTHHEELHGLLLSSPARGDVAWPPARFAVSVWSSLPPLDAVPWCTADRYKWALARWDEAMGDPSPAEAEALELWKEARRAITTATVDGVDAARLRDMQEAERNASWVWSALRWERRQAGAARLTEEMQALEDVRRGWVPPVRLVLLARALWTYRVKARWEESKRPTVISPLLVGVAQGSLKGALVVNASGGVDIEGDGGSFAVRGWLPPAASVVLQDGRMDTHNRELPWLLMIWLAMARRQAVINGSPDPRVVTLPCSKHEIERELGVRCSVEDVDAALDVLMRVSIAGGKDATGRQRDPWPMVQRVSTEERKAFGGGRPSLVRVVTCGEPLAPWVLKARLRELGVTLPPELRFETGVLDPAMVPVVGDKRTRHRQRLAMAMGLPAWMMSLREQYREKGGLRLQESGIRQSWERYSGDRFELYVRKSHASLPDDLLVAAVLGVERRGTPVFNGMPGSPIVSEAEPGTGIYRMADDGQHELIMGSAELTAKQRERRASAERAKAARAKSKGKPRR